MSQPAPASANMETAMKNLTVLDAQDTSISSPVYTPPARKLVTVRRISSINNTSERGWKEFRVSGWTVLKPRVDAKHFQVGDLVVFIEIDSCLPKIDEFEEFFWNDKSINEDDREGVLVESEVRGKYLSQGLIMNIDHFPKIVNWYQQRIREVGLTTATRELERAGFDKMHGVTKWTHPNEVLDVPAHEMGDPPAFISNVAWERVQNIRDLWTPYSARSNKVWQVTEKMDGITMQVYKIDTSSNWMTCIPEARNGYPESMRSDGCHIGICSRKRDYYDSPDSIFWRVARGSGVAARIRDIPYPNISVQGELVGSSILDNTMKYPPDTHEFIVFAIFNIDTGKYIPPKETATICRDLGIQHVPITGYYKLHQLARSTDELLKKVDSLGPGKHGGLKEGWVFRSLDGGDAFKVISNKWLDLTAHGKQPW